jgi:hypothetical protein
MTSTVTTPIYFTPGFKLIDTNSTTTVRINARGLLLSYSTPLDKEALREFLLAKPTCRHAKLWIVHEATSKTHVLIDYGSYRFETRNPQFFDFGGSHPLIMTIDGRHPTAWHRAVLYLLQNEPTNIELLSQLELTKDGTPPPKKGDQFDTVQVILLLEQLSSLGIKITV